MYLLSVAAGQAIPATTVEHVPAVDSEEQEVPSQSVSEAESGAQSTAARREGSESERMTTPFVCHLPGPSQVVTHPGMSGLSSNGERQRRRGVSGPPTGRRLGTGPLCHWRYSRIPFLWRRKGTASRVL